MGNLGFDDFSEQLKYRCGNDKGPDSAGASLLDYYGIWINKSYRQLCTQDRVLGLNKKLYFPQLMVSTTKTTTDGTAYVDAPSDCLYITEVFDTTNGRKLDRVFSWKEYISYTDRTSSDGDPTEWIRRGSSIYLHPTPGTTGDTLTIYYKKLPTDLSGSLTTDIGAEWDDVIIELAAYKAFTWLHEYDKSKVCKESFLEMAVGLADIYGKEEGDSVVSFGPSDSYIG